MPHILALPPVAKVTTLLIAAVIFLYGWLKRKMIAAALGALTKAAKRKIWGSVQHQLNTYAPPPAATEKPHNERTYRGTFVVYGKLANYRQAYIFTIEHDGITSTVPVTSTPLFSNVRRGDFVQIETQVGPYIGEEVVQRVHVIKTQDSARR